MPEEEQEYVLDDGAWEAVLQATDGLAAPCYQCGVCTATCPWGLVRGETLPVRKLMRRAQLGLGAGQGNYREELWLCTACAACEALCPRGVPIAQVMQGLRGLAWKGSRQKATDGPGAKERQVPAGLPSVLWAMYWDSNPWRRPPSQRPAWAKGLAIDEYGPSHEVLYYVGCTSSYDRRAQKVARALVGLFQAAGVGFGTLGEREPCCGETALALGQRAYAEQIIQQNSRLFAEASVGTIITTSPHCYDMFKNHYPDMTGSFRPLHYSQYLAELIEGGRLPLAGELPLRATFHDPCYLGRRNGEYDAPRRVLEAIPGLELVEMAECGPTALCCGGGGGRMWLETPPDERFADLRVEQAAETGAQVLVTACPFCIACLEDSIKVRGLPGLRVMDLAEVVALAVVLPRKDQPSGRETLAVR